MPQRLAAERAAPPPRYRPSSPASGTLARRSRPSAMSSRRVAEFDRPAARGRTAPGRPPRSRARRSGRATVRIWWLTPKISCTTTRPRVGVVRAGAPGAERVAVGGGEFDGGAHACLSLASCRVGDAAWGHGRDRQPPPGEEAARRATRRRRTAAENRARHGRTGAAEKAAERLEQERARRALDGKPQGPDAAATVSCNGWRIISRLRPETMS